MNSAFQGAYAVGLLRFGWFIDRYGTKIGYAVSIALWSVAALAHALVGSVGGFFAARVVPGRQRGRQLPGRDQGGRAVVPEAGAGVRDGDLQLRHQRRRDRRAGAVPAIAFTLGWRCGLHLRRPRRLPLAVPLVPVLRRAREAEAPDEGRVRVHQQRQGRGRRRAARRSAGAARSGYRQTWAFIVAKFLTDPVWWFFLIWLPDYFKTTRGLDIKHSWIHLVTIYAIVTVLSIAGGWLTGYLSRSGAGA